MNADIYCTRHRKTTRKKLSRSVSRENRTRWKFRWPSPDGERKLLLAKGSSLDGFLVTPLLLGPDRTTFESVCRGRRTNRKRSRPLVASQNWPRCVAPVRSSFFWRPRPRKPRELQQPNPPLRS